MRHVLAVRGKVPDDFQRFSVAGRPVGWVSPRVRAGALALGAVMDGPGLALEDPRALNPLARQLAGRGFCRLRDELFDVRDDAGAVVATVDRGALPMFGLRAWGVHVNGLVRRAAGLHVWVGFRSAGRPADPGKLDHLAAGGVAAGDGVAATLVKEAGEEAGVNPAIARTARAASVICYTMPRADGLRRDVLHCFDLALPDAFVPVPQDGEQQKFELWPAARVLDALIAGDRFKFNVALVLIDLFLREGIVRSGALREALGAAPPC